VRATGTVTVHDGGALHEFQRDIARLHDRALAGHGCSRTLNLLYVPRHQELFGRRRSLAPGADVMVGASKFQESNLIQELKERYGQTDEPAAQMFSSDSALLARESIRFDPKIVRILREMWKLYDDDNSGFIDEEEYVFCSPVGLICTAKRRTLPVPH
jgi:hypothetical protein